MAHDKDSHIDFIPNSILNVLECGNHIVSTSSTPMHEKHITPLNKQ